jgi:hypothetical protein
MSYDYGMDEDAFVQTPAVTSAANSGGGLLSIAAKAPAAFVYNSTVYEYAIVVLPLAAITAVGVVANLCLFVYILWHRLYHNFISSHFIAHLCVTNMLALSVLVPLFLLNVWTGRNFWENSNLMCRVQVGVEDSRQQHVTL